MLVYTRRLRGLRLSAGYVLETPAAILELAARVDRVEFEFGGGCIHLDLLHSDGRPRHSVLLPVNARGPYLTTHAAPRRIVQPSAFLSRTGHSAKPRQTTKAHETHNQLCLAEIPATKSAICLTFALTLTKFRLSEANRWIDSACS